MTFAEEINNFTDYLSGLEQKALKNPIAWISVNPTAQTGYGVQTREVVGRLVQKGYNIIVLRGGGKTEWSPDNKTILTLSNNEQITVKVLPTYGNTAGRDQWQEYCKEYNFDLLITLWDCFIINDYTQYHELVEGVHHIPIDTVFTRKMYEMLKDANLILAMSKFGYNQLIKWFPLYKIHYIPHGVDTTIYRPYTTDERKILREKRGLREDDFVFLSVVANAGIRKRIPVLLEILRSVIQQHKNVYLFLFSNFDVPYWAGYDLISLIHEYNIVDNVFIPDKSTFKQPHSVQEMVDLYNMADCYISTSQGEGFALPILEGLACGLPAIVPNNSTMPELMNNGQNGWLVENVPGYIIEDHMFGIPTDQTYPLPDKYLFRKQIIHVLKNKQERLEKCKNAREFAVQNYDWSKLMPLWENLIINQMEKISLKNEIKAELQKQLQ